MPETTTTTATTTNPIGAAELTAMDNVELQLCNNTIGNKILLNCNPQPWITSHYPTTLLQINALMYPDRCDGQFIASKQQQTTTFPSIVYTMSSGATIPLDSNRNRFIRSCRLRLSLSAQPPKVVFQFRHNYPSTTTYHPNRSTHLSPTPLRPVSCLPPP